MANQENAADELLLDVKVAEASRLYKFYLIQEKKILGTASVAIFLTVWELVGNTFQLINPMFMSAPSLVFNAAVELFASGEIFNDLYVSGVELFGGYFLSALFAVPFGIMIGWYKKVAYIFDPFVNAMNATPRASAFGDHMAGNRHPFEGRHYLFGRGLSYTDQCARWGENENYESSHRRQEFWRIGVADLQNRCVPFDSPLHP